MLVDVPALQYDKSEGSKLVRLGEELSSALRLSSRDDPDILEIVLTRFFEADWYMLDSLARRLAKAEERSCTTLTVDEAKRLIECCHYLALKLPEGQRQQLLGSGRPVQNDLMAIRAGAPRAGKGVRHG